MILNYLFYGFRILVTSLIVPGFGIFLLVTHPYWVLLGQHPGVSLSGNLIDVEYEAIVFDPHHFFHGPECESRLLIFPLYFKGRAR